MAALDRMASIKQLTKQTMAVAEDKSKIMKAAINRSASKELDVAIVKATTSQFHVVPKEKHVRTLKNAVHPAKPRREVHYIIQELLKRLHSATDWVTALKTLIVFHRLMRETDPSFIEELIKVSEESSVHSSATKGMPMGGQRGEGATKKSRGGAVLRVDNFIDTTNIEGKFECSEWVRAYGQYLDEQLEVYSAINFYLEQEDSSGESRLRRLAPKDLLFQLPKLQKLLVRLTDCMPRGAAAKDDIVQLSVMMVVKESFKLYKVISEGVINLADTFFEMDYLDASRGLESYKQFLAFSESLQTYYAQIDSVDEVKRHVQLPMNFSLETPPHDFLVQMENYVKEAPRTVDESAAHAPHKVSPPLRRGRQASSRVLRPQGSLTSRSSQDPGMVLPPGCGSKVQAEAARAAGGAAAAPAGPKEVDLLALDMEETLQVVEAQVPEYPVQDTSTAPPSDHPLADLFANSFSSQAPSVGGFGSSFTGTASQASPVPPMAGFGGPSFSSQAGMQAPQAGMDQGNPFGAPAASPPPLQTSGFGEAPAFSPQPGAFSPTPYPPAFATTPQPGNFSPVPQFSQQSPQAPQRPPSPLDLGLTPMAQPGGASPRSTGVSPVPPNTNIRNSALHDPFAEFNMLRKPEPQVAHVQPSHSMKAMRASAEGSLAGMANGFSSPSVQGMQQGMQQGMASGQPPASPQPTYRPPPSQVFAGMSASFSGAVGGVQQQHSFSGTGSFTSVPVHGYMAQGSGPGQPQMSAGSFGGTAAFPMQFDDNNRGSTLL